MRTLRRIHAVDPDARVVGYVNRRTGEVVCPEHGRHDVESPRSPWAAVCLVDRVHARYEATAPVICHECGAWLNNESTSYANVSPQADYWRRWLRGALVHRAD
jgi:hypothetical protein